MRKDKTIKVDRETKNRMDKLAKKYKSFDEFIDVLIATYNKDKFISYYMVIVLTILLVLVVLGMVLWKSLNT